jgi:hypothetical protein
MFKFSVQFKKPVVSEGESNGASFAIGICFKVFFLLRLLAPFPAFFRLDLF